MVYRIEIQNAVGDVYIGKEFTSINTRIKIFTIFFNKQYIWVIDDEKLLKLFDKHFIKGKSIDAVINVDDRYNMYMCNYFYTRYKWDDLKTLLKK